jgi:hypothetical protein
MSKGKPFIVPEITRPLQIQLTLCENLFVSFKTEGGKKKPCIRIGNKKGAISSIKPWWKVGHTRELYNAKVFKTVLSDDNTKYWKRIKKVGYIIAHNETHARSIANERFSRIIRYSKGMGRYAWSRAMVLIANKQQPLQTSNTNPVNQNVNVQINKDGYSSGNYSITVNNNLDYASYSLKHGEAYVTTAMMKAANATNAIINKFIDKHKDDFFSNVSDLDKMKTPFPKDMMQ